MISRFVYFVSPSNIFKLKMQRETLAKEVIDYVNEHIAQADPKYAEERIISQHEAQKGYDENKIIISRNTKRKMKKEYSEQIDSVLN